MKNNRFYCDMSLKHNSIFILLAVLLYSTNVLCKPLENLEDMSTSVSEEITTTRSPTILSNIHTEDAAINFLKKLINTGYASSQIALRRIEKAKEKRKELEDNIEKFLESLPNYSAKIPILDDFPKLV